MPIRSLSGLARIVHALTVCRLRNVLDLGVGLGTYGAGIRQWREPGGSPVWTRLVGVEGIPGHRTPCGDLYDVLHATGIEESLPMLDQIGERFDAVLLGDAIRHFEKSAGEALLPQIDRVLTSRGALFVITREHDPSRRSAVPLRSEWTAGDLRRLGFEILLDGNRENVGCKMLAAFRGTAGR